jgi:hypothetical protein
MTRPAIAALLVLALAGALTACGKEGDLERPGPLWGAKAKADWEAAHRPAPPAPASNGIPPLPADADNSVGGGAPSP